MQRDHHTESKHWHIKPNICHRYHLSMNFSKWCLFDSGHLNILYSEFFSLETELKDKHKEIRDILLNIFLVTYCSSYRCSFRENINKLADNQENILVLIKYKSIYNNINRCLCVIVRSRSAFWKDCSVQCNKIRQTDTCMTEVMHFLLHFLIIFPFNKFSMHFLTFFAFCGHFPSLLKEIWI